MREDKWKDTVAMIKSKFTVLSEGTEPLEDIPRATLEFIEFNGPQGKMRLERTTKPAVLDKKTIYSKLGGRAAKIEYTYDETEMVHRLQAFQWNESRGEWEEVRTPMA